MTPPTTDSPSSRLRREWEEFRQGIGLNQAIGAGLAFVGMVLTLIVALLNWGNEFILALIAIAAQFGAAALFAKGRAEEKFEPGKYAESSFAFLVLLARRASDSEQATQEVIEMTDPDPATVLATLRAVNVQLSHIQELALMASDDWLRVLDQPVQYGLSVSQVLSTPNNRPE